MAQLLLEHHGKALLRQGGIAVPEGVVVRDTGEARFASRGLDAPVVVKAQVPAGGRGKAGGVVVADDAEALHEAVERLLGHRFGGFRAASVLIERKIDFRVERYISLGITNGRLTLMVGNRGGIDVEENTGSIATLPVDPVAGIETEALRQVLRRLDLPRDLDSAYLDLARNLFTMVRERDAAMVEINPLVETDGGMLVALDARIAIDTAALPRQPDLAVMLQDSRQDDGRTSPAALVTIRPNPNGGTIGLIGLGGGLNLSIVDWVAHRGCGIHSLTDIDAAIAAGRAADAFAQVIASYDAEPAIAAILINIITAGYRLDDIVAALVPSLTGRAEAAAKPVVLHLHGNAMSETPAMLAAAGTTNAASLEDAITAAVAAAGG